MREPNLVGSVSNSPYSFEWTNVLAGSYALRAQVVDVSGAAAYSSPARITVGSGGNEQVVNFDALNAVAGPVTDGALSNYLAGFGMKVTSVSPGTLVAVENQAWVAGAGRWRRRRRRTS